MGAITAGATAYYFLQVGQTGGCKRAKTEVVEEPQMKTPLKLKSFENRWTTDSNPVEAFTNMLHFKFKCFERNDMHIVFLVNRFSHAFTGSKHSARERGHEGEAGAT